MKLSKENFISNVSNNEYFNNIDDFIECDDKLKIFWQYNNIGPYNWLKIENFTKTQINKHINSVNKTIIVDECNISINKEIKKKRCFHRLH
jgi:hypothetical protein